MRQRHLPIWPTAMMLVMLAVLISLGAWQLARKGQKEALLADLAKNSAEPPIPIEKLSGEPTELSFRRVTLDCRFDGTVEVFPGASPKGKAGLHVYALCDYEEGRHPLAVDIGWIGVRDAMPDLRDRQVRIIASVRPWVERTAVETFSGASRPTPSSFGARAADQRFFAQAISLQPLDGQPSITSQPSPLRVDDIPNNHRSYAFQWFSFAAILAVIYGVYVWRWRRLQAAQPDDTVRRS